jgi:drug/metabolite transporter (DMT)-like permease
MNSLLFFMAMQRTTLSIAVLTHYLAPVLVAALAPLVLKEAAGPRVWFALALALGGLTLLLEPWRAPADGVLAGAALGTGSAVFYAANVLVTKRIQKWFSPYEILGWHLPSALLVLAFFLPEGAFETPLVPLSLVACAGLLIGAFGGILYLRGLSRVPASRASVLTLLEPVVAVLVGAAVWGELLGPLAMLGGLLVLGAAASVMVTSSRRAAEPNA